MPNKSTSKKSHRKITVNLPDVVNRKFERIMELDGDDITGTIHRAIEHYFYFRTNSKKYNDE